MIILSEKHNPNLNTLENFRKAKTDENILALLVKNNISLVNKMVFRLARNQNQRDEFASEGYIALQKAILSFDPDLGGRFSAYLTPYVNNAIRRFMLDSNQFSLPEYKIQQYQKIRNEISNSENPDVASILEKHHITAPEFLELAHLVNDPDHLNRPVKGSDEKSRTLGDTVATNIDGTRGSFNVEVKRKFLLVKNIIDELPLEYQRYYHFKFDMQLGPVEIGKEMGISTNSAWRLEKSFLESVRTFLRQAPEFANMFDDDKPVVSRKAQKLYRTAKLKSLLETEEGQQRYLKLTPLQKEVLTLYLDPAMSRNEIAEGLGRTAQQISQTIDAVLLKMGVQTPGEENKKIANARALTVQRQNNTREIKALLQTEKGQQIFSTLTLRQKNILQTYIDNPTLSSKEIADKINSSSQYKINGSFCVNAVVNSVLQKAREQNPNRARNR